VRGRVAPVALTGRSAERTHLRGVDRARREALERDVLRITRENGRQPITGRSFDAPLVHACVLHWIDTRHELGLPAPSTVWATNASANEANQSASPSAANRNDRQPTTKRPDAKKRPATLVFLRRLALQRRVTLFAVLATLVCEIGRA